MLMPNGPIRITSGPFDPELYKSEHEVEDPELKVTNNIIIIWCYVVFNLLINAVYFGFLQALLESSASRKTQKKKKKKVCSA